MVFVNAFSWLGVGISCCVLSWRDLNRCFNSCITVKWRNCTYPCLVVQLFILCVKGIRIGLIMRIYWNGPWICSCSMGVTLSLRWSNLKELCFFYELVRVLWQRHVHFPCLSVDVELTYLALVQYSRTWFYGNMILVLLLT